MITITVNGQLHSCVTPDVAVVWIEDALTRYPDAIVSIAEGDNRITIYPAYGRILTVTEQSA